MSDHQSPTASIERPTGHGDAAKLRLFGNFSFPFPRAGQSGHLANWLQDTTSADSSQFVAICNQTLPEVMMSNPVRQFLDYLGANDLPAALELVAEDAVFLPEGPADVPIYGEFLGKAGAEKLFTTLGELFETERFEIIDWAEAGNTVFAHGTMRHRVRRTGTIVGSGFALVVTIARDKITHWRIYENSAAFQSALA